MRYKEARSLEKVTVIWDNGTGWTLKRDGKKLKTFRGTKQEFAKFLQQIRAKDDMTSPRSKRNETYAEIVDDIVTGRDRVIWVWSSDMKEKANKTAKCPECGNKYLVQTGYCLSCKKKVAKPKSEEIEVSEDFFIPGTDTIIEAGDKIRILQGED